MDTAGRLVIPKMIRREAGFTPGMELEIRCRDGRVELPAPRAVRMLKKGQLFVAVPREASELLSARTVRRTQETIRGRDGRE